MAKKATESTPPPEPTFILSPAQSAWLIVETSKTEYRAGVKDKFKRVFGAELPEEIFQDFVNQHQADISALRYACRGEIDSHPNSDPYIRIEKFEEIRKLAIEGVCVGISKDGDPVIKVDLNNAREALKECRAEKQMIIQNDLNLLGMLIRAKQINPTVGGNTQLDNPAALAGETTVTDVTGTSDTMKFLNFDK